MPLVNRLYEPGQRLSWADVPFGSKLTASGEKERPHRSRAGIALGQNLEG
jgi:hypothetical protein